MIPKEFKKVYELNEELQSLENIEHPESSEYNIYSDYLDPKYQEFLKKHHESSPEYLLRKQIEEEFIKQYKNFVANNQYFFGCPIEIYELNYQERMIEFMSKNNGSKEIDFLIQELNSIKFNPDSSKQNIPKEYHEEIKRSFKRQEEFILEKVDLLDYDVIEENSKYSYEIRPFTNQAKNSDKSILSATEKVIYLELLGVTDFIRSKAKNNISTNQLSEIIGLITGENNTTIQSYLNPIGNPNVEQRRNPMNKTDKVKAIRLKLAELQFTLPEKESK